MEMWDRVWDFGVDEVGDEDDPEMPLGTIQCIWTR
jgi:hypothetical protein